MYIFIIQNLVAIYVIYFLYFSANKIKISIELIICCYSK